MSLITPYRNQIYLTIASLLTRMIVTHGFALVHSVLKSLWTFQTPASESAFIPFLCSQACTELAGCGGLYWSKDNVS